MAVISIVVISSFVWAQEEGRERSGNEGLWPKETKDVLSVETEFYAGQRGFLHGGLILEKPISEKMHLGLNGHFVRESSEDGNFSPSLGAEFGIEITDGFVTTQVLFFDEA